MGVKFQDSGNKNISKFEVSSKYQNINKKRENLGRSLKKDKNLIFGNEFLEYGIANHQMMSIPKSIEYGVFSGNLVTFGGIDSKS